MKEHTNFISVLLASPPRVHISFLVYLWMPSCGYQQHGNNQQQFRKVRDPVVPMLNVCMEKGLLTGRRGVVNKNPSCQVIAAFP